jgi:quinol-cytochrome oxidoreductase complex cytochrome b subunit
VGSGLYKWLDDRLKISILQQWLGKKEVPQHNQSHWYYFGGMALFLFIVQVITGLLLLVYYQPGLETSYKSIQFITDKVEFGWLIRSIHSWAANLMVASLFVHMFSAFFMKAYRAPREITWLTGFVLFVITLGLGFSGYLLPWDELSYFATKVGLGILQATPVVGPFMADLLRGGDAVGGPTIGRFFELHIILLPAALIAVLGLHLLMVQVHGMSKPYVYANKPAKYRKSIPFFSEFLYHDVIIWSVMLGVIVLIAAVFPWGLGPEADPFKPAPDGIKPEWYFMFMFQILKFLPAHVGPFEGEVVGIVGFMIAGGLWFLVPLWEGINRTTQKLATAMGVLGVVVILSMTIWGYMEPSQAPLTAATGSASDTAQLADKGAALFKQNCSACHSIGGGPLAGPDLKGVTTKRDATSLAAFILDPASFGSAMPKLPGITEDDVKQIVAYLQLQDNPPKQPVTTDVKAIPVKAVVAQPFSPDTIATGKQLFLGMRPFAKGAPACISCHAVTGATEFGGGNLGGDLSGVFKKLGGRQGLTPWLSSIPSPTMSPLYKEAPLTEPEVQALVAFLEDASQQKHMADQGKLAVVSKKQYFVLLGLLGMLAVLGLFAVVYANRFRGVRKPLVYGDDSSVHVSDAKEP